MLQHFFFIFIQLQLLQDQMVSFNGFVGCKTQGQLRSLRMILDQMAYRMDAAVYGTVMIVFIAEILPQRPFLIFCHMDCMTDQFIHAFVFRSGNRDYGYSQERFHGVHIDGAVIAGDFIHHVQGYDHGNVHFQQLHGQIQITLYIRRIHDIDDSSGFLIQDKITGYDLFTAVRGHGINTGQVCHQSIRIPLDGTVLTVYGNSGEISHMLIRAGELIEQCSLAAVLISRQGER